MAVNHPQFDYDFIVTGAGAAGRSFVYQLLQSPLRNSRILLIDREIKNKDDRTWSYWEDSPGLFDKIVHHRWHKLWFHSDTLSREMDIAPFEYKMILASDFYRFTDQAFAAHPQIKQLKANIQQIQNEPEGVTVKTSEGNFSAAWCINSTGRPKIDKSKVNYLDQHFRGWFIKTEKAVFDPKEATLMDFRTPQAGEFRFHYVLPTSETEALVELAIFSNDHLQSDGYDRIIKAYLTAYWPQLGNYTIERAEQGNIPMTDYQFLPHEGRIIHLGQIGGDTRASTGYTFLYIHRRVQDIIAALTRNEDPRLKASFSKKRHYLYDSIMLRVLQKDKYPGDQLFSGLFRHNPPQRLLRFLNGESTILEEMGVAGTAPTLVFLRAAIKSVLRFVYQKRIYER